MVKKLIVPILTLTLLSSCNVVFVIGPCDVLAALLFVTAIVIFIRAKYRK